MVIIVILLKMYSKFGPALRLLTFKQTFFYCKKFLLKYGTSFLNKFFKLDPDLLKKTQLDPDPH